jgi:hypothetical protein
MTEPRVLRRFDGKWPHVVNCGLGCDIHAYSCLPCDPLRVGNDNDRPVYQTSAIIQEPYGRRDMPEARHFSLERIMIDYCRLHHRPTVTDSHYSCIGRRQLSFTTSSTGAGVGPGGLTTVPERCWNCSLQEPQRLGSLRHSLCGTLTPTRAKSSKATSRRCRDSF